MEVYKRCRNCQKVEQKMMLCGACKAARYCSAKCQKADWSKHKLSCDGKNKDCAYYMKKINRNQKYNLVVTVLVRLIKETPAPEGQEKVIAAMYNFGQPSSYGKFFIDLLPTQETKDMRKQERFPEDSTLVYLYIHENEKEQGFKATARSDELDGFQTDMAAVLEDSEKDVLRVLERLRTKPPTAQAKMVVPF